MNNIVLIGMPGVGKSTVGVILAKVLGYQFLDTDLLIQQQEGMRLKEIIEKRGVDGFIQIENKINCEIEVSKTIIATGGSVIYGKEAMQHLKTIGTVLYLKVSFDIIEKRLHNISGRGVVSKAGQDLESLYQERVALYEKYADVVIDEGKMNVEETVEAIVNKICIA